MSDLFTPDARVLTSRREFFKRAGGGLAAIGLFAGAATMAGCDSDDPDPQDNAVVLDFANDFGVLNYAYALEQLEAAFYAAVVGASGFATAFPDATERSALMAIAKHEAIHADFLKVALGPNAIGPLTPDFSSITFTSRTSVLGTALVFEDLGVAAYNGAGAYISDPTYLTLAGKIVSVEARHASYIAGIITPNAIAGSGVIDAQGLDRAFTPAQVLTAADPFITNTITIRNA